MKHPYQNIVSTSTHLFVSVQNHLQAFDVEGNLVGSWKDTIGHEDLLKKQQLEKIEKLNQEPEIKRAENNKKVKIPKIPTPGPGAPTIYNYIRDLELTHDNKYLIGITDSDKSIIIFEINLNEDNCLKLIKRQTFPKRPCSISIADDNSTVIIGDKFGDVYKIPIIGENVPEKDLKPILGHVSLLTDVLITEHNGKQYILSSDRDEHIKVSNYPITYVVKHWLFGHDEFISSMVQFDFDRELLVTGGGDDYIYLWNWYGNKLLSKYPLRDLIEPLLDESHLPPERFLHEDSPKEISVVKMITMDKFVVVLFQKVNGLLVLEIKDETLHLVELFPLDYPLIDISAGGDKIFGLSEDKIITQFTFNGKLTIDDKEFKGMIENNPCEVQSKEEFYPLYTMNTLRKRSEH
ncbi:tRNA (guanine-N(7)-)-methyltransferase non-catalytic subunit Trm82p [[Candida] jaroonii]|uniref:tRNA (Guanine-N(7)-)-methyltransferase non-catalytic subunit Trm82p n=1 Tax=[Candida] jaroonii TaxID=467808 RepID=A0ACA9Y4D7_9ASCO|nr:tRNA (guanine-N(7)-)-methyltransferase non-catalytic subunit Trm82p [[Candida] jaroonii]